MTDEKRVPDIDEIWKQAALHVSNPDAHEPPSLPDILMSLDNWHLVARVMHRETMRLEKENAELREKIRTLEGKIDGV